MYIRTKTSNLDIGGEIYIIDDDNFKIVDNDCGLEVWRKETNTRRPIKSMGDNLIDVLELTDKFELIALIEDTIYLCTLVEIIKSENLIRFLMQDGIFYSLSTILMTDKNYKILSITAHEQYMKLAQEIK
jgi:hypothetical protein